MSEIKTYCLKNEYLEVHVLNYGGIIDKIYCADKAGTMANVVLSYQDQADYIQIPGPYLNALVGPVAGRIAGGKYHQRVLSCNDGSNHLHGGKKGISFDYFEMEQISEEKLVARLEKKHDEDGYRGIFHYIITYTLVQNALVLNYDVHVSEPNLLYLTSHLYFNLSGGLKRTVSDEILCSDFKKMIYVDETCAPSKVVDIARGSTFDFSEGKCIGDVIKQGHEQFAFTRGIDHPFFVNGKIVLADEVSGRQLTITSDAPCAVIYSANFIDETMTFENNVKGCPQLGLAIELQDYANGIHLGLGKETTCYSQRTVYAFEVKK